MATTVQITLSLDASGAITMVDQFGKQLQQLPQPHPRVRQEFNNIESAERRAHIAGQLFTRLLGVELPRSLETVIAKSSLLGPLMAGAFNVAVIGTAIQAAIGFAEEIANIAQSIGGLNKATKKMMADAVAASNEAMANPKTLDIAKQHLSVQSQVVGTLSKQAEEWKNMSALQKAALIVADKFYGDANDDIRGMVDAQDRLNNANDVYKQLSENEVKLVRAVRDENLKSQSEINEAGLKGFRLIQQQHADEDRMARASFDLQSGMSDALSNRLKANAAKTAAAIKELYQGESDELIKISEAAGMAGLKGDRRITQELQDNIANYENSLMEKEGVTYAMLQKDQRLHAMVENAKLSYTALADQQRVELHRQALGKIQDLESQAAVLAVPEWQRADAQIIADLNKTYREIQREEDDTIINGDEAQRERVAAWEIANEKIREEHKRLVEQLGSDIASLWDDISSGNIGKRILDNIKKLISMMIAQWILGLTIMKSVAGSILGSIVFGPGSTGAGVFGGGASLFGSGGILGGLFGSSGAAVPGPGAASTSVTIPGVGTVPASLLGGGLGAAASGVGGGPTGSFAASGALTSQTLSSIGSGAALPGLVGGTTSQLGAKGSLLGGLFSARGMAGLASMGVMLAGAFGGQVGQIGGMLASLGLMSGSLPLLAAALPLVSFGLGQNHGSLAGGIFGFMTGGLLGLFSGIFGGIFGGGKRKKQANALVDNTVLPDIQQIITGYDAFQIDQSSAIQQLEQLRTDAQKQLSQLKGQGKDVFNKRVNPAIDDAEKHIRDIQAERDRRSSTVFGPPQFALGGMFSAMRAGGPGLAVLHDGEYVVNPQATKKNRAALERMNAGGSVGGITVVVAPQLLDVKDFDGYLKRGGIDVITKAIGRALNEGKW